MLGQQDGLWCYLPIGIFFSYNVIPVILITGIFSGFFVLCDVGGVQKILVHRSWLHTSLYIDVGYIDLTS